MEPHINQMYAEWRRFREELGEDWTTLRELAREYRMHKERQGALGEELKKSMEADPSPIPTGVTSAPQPVPEAGPSPAAPEPSSEPAAVPQDEFTEPAPAPPPTPPEPQ